MNYLRRSIGWLALLLVGPATAVQCNTPQPLVALARAAGVQTSAVQECTLGAEAAVNVTGQLNSSLVRARGYVDVTFVDANGRKLWSARRGPWLGKFAALALDETVPVPAGAKRVRITATAESTRADGNGEWRLLGLQVGGGAVASLDALDGTVVLAGAPTRWDVSVGVHGANAAVQLNFLSLDGGVVKTLAADLSATSKSTVLTAPALPVGYYDVQATVTTPGNQPNLLHSALVVLPATPVSGEKRFGMDAALSWYGGTPEMVAQSASLMLLAGIGTARDRLSWSRVQGKPGEPVWGKNLEVANTMHAAGIESVEVFHDSPSWAHKPGQKSADMQVPTDDNAVYAFGRAYARGLGKVARSVEYWNEQNTNFFPGYPYQYASGLKAFAAGVKSVDPAIRVLIGAAAARPGPFFEQTYRNDVADDFDVRNQHYYGKDADLAGFMAGEVTKIEADGGVANRPGWLTEMGFGLNRDAAGGWRRAELEQAQYLVKTYAAGFAHGYERVFFFYWRELVEAELHTWGILREDFSPRPAYLALALLTRHLAGAELAAVERQGKGETVYFRKAAGGFVAVSWGGGKLNANGPTVSATDVFGSPVALNDTPANGVPLLVSGIGALPASAKPVSLASSPLLGQAPLRISAKVMLAGREADTGGVNRIAVSVGDGDTVELLGQVFSSASNAAGAARVTCSAGKGLTLLSAAEIALPPIGATGQSFACRYNAALSSVGDSHMAATVEQNGKHDKVSVALVPDAARVLRTNARTVLSDSACLTWGRRASANVELLVNNKPAAGADCPTVTVQSRVTQTGDTWVFPMAALKAEAFSGAQGIQFKLGGIAGVAPPPTSVMVQLVERTGGIWLLPMAPSGGGVVSGLFNLARPAPWARDDNARLDLANLKEIMIGWGGYGGDAGQQHGFSIDSLKVFSSGQ